MDKSGLHDCALHHNFLPLHGSWSLQLEERIESATGQRVVGVSVCWDFGEHEEDVMELLESQLVEKDSALHPEPVAEEEPEELQSWFAKMERSTMLQHRLQTPTKLWQG